MKKQFSANCFTALVLSSILALSLTACGDSGVQEIRFGTGGTAGTYYNYGTALAELAAHEYPPIEQGIFRIGTGSE